MFLIIMKKVMMSLMIVMIMIISSFVSNGAIAKEFEDSNTFQMTTIEPIKSENLVDGSKITPVLPVPKYKFIVYDLVNVDVENQTALVRDMATEEETSYEIGDEFLESEILSMGYQRFTIENARLGCGIWDSFYSFEDSYIFEKKDDYFKIYKVMNINPTEDKVEMLLLNSGEEKIIEFSLGDSIGGAVINNYVTYWEGFSIMEFDSPVKKCNLMVRDTFVFWDFGFCI